MPPNARRRSLKIVTPLSQSKEQEIVGGLRNALERGETLAKAKQSFLNAGYKTEEVEAAVQKMPTINSQISKLVTASTESETPAAQPAQTGAQPLPTTTANIPGQKKHLSKKFIIILVSSAIAALAIAGLLGLFWNKIF